MKLREKIKEIVYHESDMDKIMELIQQEVRECIGEKEEVPVTLQNGEYERNCLRSDIKEKLKQKGLL